MKKYLFLLIIAVLFSCGKKPLWKDVNQYTINYLDINHDPFIRIEFAQFKEDKSYYVFVADKLNNIQFDTIGIKNDTIKELNFFPKPEYQITIKIPIDKELPIVGINRKTWLYLSKTNNKFKRNNKPYRYYGAVLFP